MIDVFKDGIGQPVGAEELPDIFDWVQFGSARPAALPRAGQMAPNNQALA